MDTGVGEGARVKERTNVGAGVRHREEAAEKGWHPWIGAHFSIAGGLQKAIEAADEMKTGAVQIFTKPGGQWKAKPLAEAAVSRFRDAVEELGPFELAVHGSYLVNLASVDKALRKQSIEAFLEEIDRCETLGIPRLVFHPGAHLGRGDDAGLEMVADALHQCLSQTRGYQTRLLVENTAGQGSNIGYRLSHLAYLLDELGRSDRLRVCLDTCHLFAAGYDFRDEETYGALRAELEATVGLSSVDLFHLNDSKKPFGSRKDRHDNVGSGEIGNAGFGFFLKDPAFRSVPMVVETPVEEEGHQRDVTRLRRLSKI